MPTTRLIAILAVPGVQLLDVSGPLDVFAEANAQAGVAPGAPPGAGRAPYRLLLLAPSNAPIRASSGARLLPDAAIDDAPRPDTLLVAGAPHLPRTRPDPRLVASLARTAPKARRYGSVCTGAFLLAAAGLLDGKRVATHWAAAERLARDFPAVTVDADAIHLRDGKLRTAAGVTAGLDLALALVEEDLGPALARRVASQLVMFFKRPGGQSQFSREGHAAPAGRSALQQVQRWAAAHPSADLSVPALAARAGLSERHFARLFAEEVGTPPGAWVDASRVAAARDLLERHALAPKQVAAQCGFADDDTLRRAFARHLGVTPAQYRRHHGVKSVPGPPCRAPAQAAEPEPEHSVTDEEE